MLNFESTSLGALFIVLKFSGFYNEISEASKDIIKFDKFYEPNLEYSNYYDDLYNLSNEISLSLKESFEMRVKNIKKKQTKIENHIENL